MTSKPGARLNTVTSQQAIPMIKKSSKNLNLLQKAAENNKLAETNYSNMSKIIVTSFMNKTLSQKNMVAEIPTKEPENTRVKISLQKHFSNLNKKFNEE